MVLEMVECGFSFSFVYTPRVLELLLDFAFLRRLPFSLFSPFCFFVLDLCVLSAALKGLPFSSRLYQQLNKS